MLKAIAAKVVRAAAKAGRAFFALAALPRFAPRFALSPVKVKAVVCRVALVAVLSPAVFIAAEEAQAQTPPTAAECAQQGKEPPQGSSTQCSSTCLSGFVRAGNNCNPIPDCATDGVDGTVLNTRDNVCECPNLPAATGQGTPTYAIDGRCQTASAHCTGQGLYANSTPDENTITLHVSVSEANTAYCRVCQQSDNHYSFGGDCEIPKRCNLVRGQFVDYPNANNECVCPSGPPPQSASDDRAVLLSDAPTAPGMRTCAPALPTYSNGYNRAACEAAGWDVKFWAVPLPDPDGGVDRDGNARGGYHLVESCNIRVQFVDGISLSAQSQIVVEGPGEFRNSCILRHNTGADVAGAVGASGSLFCDDGQLFGDAGLPMKPDSFRATPNGDHLFVISTMTADNVNQRIAFDDTFVTPDGTFVPVVVDPIDPTDPMMTMMMSMAMTMTGGDGAGGGTGGTGSGSGGGGGGGAGPAAGAGILLIGLAYVAFADGDPSAFHITPKASFRIEDDIPRHSYGARMEINKDEWTLWWTADESSVGDADGVFGFGYGGEWNRDALHASASVYTDMEEDVSELRAGLRTEWTLSNWTVRPAYRFRAEVERGEWTFENGLDLAAQLSQAGWIIRPSVNADLWAAAEPDARLRLQVGREF